MADPKTLTKQDLLEAVKGLATKDDLQTMESRFDGKLTSLESRMDGKLTAMQANLDGKLGDMEARFDDKLEALETRMDGKLTALEANLTREFKDYVGQAVEALEGPINETLEQVKQINGRLDKLEQNTVSKKEFIELKDRVDHIPAY